MADILPFKKPVAGAGSDARPRGNALCRNGHHKWVVDKAKQFDVKQGRLVTRYRCSRCGCERVTAH